MNVRLEVILYRGERRVFIESLILKPSRDRVNVLDEFVEALTRHASTPRTHMLPRIKCSIVVDINSE